MRHIEKQHSSVGCLGGEQQSPPNDSKEAKNRWAQHRDKDDLTKLLRDEQYWLCAYTELRPDEIEIGTHIEHIKPKSHYPDLTFDYHNLVLCALSSSDLRKPNFKGQANRFGGHAKGDNYDQNLFISPLDPISATSFLYQNNGLVVPNPKKSTKIQHKAEYTIVLLKLNAPFLINRRKRQIEEIDQAILEKQNKPQELAKLKQLELGISNGKLNQFFTALSQRF